MNENPTKLFCDAMETGRSAALATVISASGSTPRDAGAKMIVYEDGGFAGTVGGGKLESLVMKDCLASLKEGTGGKFVYDLKPEGIGMICMGKVEVFIEVAVRSLQVLILGAGHVGEAVAAVCSSAGLPTIVADDRSEFANAERFPRSRVLLASPPAAVSQAGTDAKTYVVIVTRGHALDGECLEAALRTEAPYIGMIGSKNKVATIVKAARKKVPKADVSRVYAPVGLDLGGKSPGEIAVSIAAEIIKLRYDRPGGHMRLKEACS
ncbi:MAG: XdhC family protein [Elusimicrobia bacterium]|nr:XdhC family protein [Elusimicrobiota bacterium]